MKNRNKIMSMILAASMLVCGCAAKEDKEEPPVQQQEEVEASMEEKLLEQIRPYAYSNVDGLEMEPGSYISVIARSKEGDFWAEVERGVRAAAKELNEELGYKGEQKIKVTFNAPGEAQNVDEQVNILDEELARYPDALAISLIDTHACEVQFDLATMNGIPLVAFDSGSDYPGLMCKVGTDNVKAAQRAAQGTAEMMQETGSVLVFAQDHISESSMNRVKGFCDEIKNNHPGIRIANVYYMDELDEKKENMINELKAGTYSLEEEGSSLDLETLEVKDITTEQIMEYIFRKNPDATAAFGTNVATVNAILNAKKNLEKEQLIITGFDVDPELLKELEAKTVSGLIIQNPYGMGYATVIAAARSALEMGNEAVVDTGYEWILPNNVKEGSLELD